MTINRKQAENIASVLSEGLPYIQKFKNKIIVVKYGGAAMVETKLKESFTRDIALMKLVGMRPVIVHGGGPQIGEELKKAGIFSEFINGHRVTTKETMNVVKQVLGIKVNKEIVQLIKTHGGNAVSFNHKKFKIIKAIKTDDGESDLGYVGQITKILTTELLKSLKNDLIPVIAPIGLDKKNVLILTHS